ncbi:Heme transporter HRG family-containing protein [Aphelenchoides besseyi]|nr:Heme transporter HRG family-containing protein [Aphelenchoides besseyi]
MKCAMRVKIIWAILGITAGPVAGSMFWMQYHNYSAAIMAFFSSICASYLLYTHIAFHKSWIIDWSSTRIRVIIVVNTVLCVLAFASMIVCLTIAGIRRTPIAAKGVNLWLTSVWLWMTFKLIFDFIWTMMSALYTRRYAQNVMHPLLFRNDETQTANGDVREIQSP